MQTKFKILSKKLIQTKSLLDKVKVRLPVMKKEVTDLEYLVSKLNPSTPQEKVETNSGELNSATVK